MDPTKTVTSFDAADNILRNTFRLQFRNTQLCKFHAAKRCRAGNDCAFSHSLDSIESAPDLTKTSLCNRWMQGVCPLSSDKCQFAHGKVELRRTPAFAKTPHPHSAGVRARLNSDVAVRAPRLNAGGFHSEASAASGVAPVKSNPMQVACTVRDLAETTDKVRHGSGDGGSESGASTRSGSTHGEAPETPTWSIFDMSPGFIPVMDPFAVDTSCYEPRFFEYDVESDVSTWFNAPWDSMSSLSPMPQSVVASEPFSPCGSVYSALDTCEGLPDYGPDAYNPLYLVCDESDRVGISTNPADFSTFAL